MRNIGILLRTMEGKYSRLFLLDNNNGKICAFSTRCNMSRGSLISYILRNEQTITSVHSIDVLDLPTITNHNDLIFFHQVLELLYYFLPLNVCMPDIFDLTIYVYTSLEKLKTNTSRKLFLCKLFIHLGFDPATQSTIPFFYAIRIQRIDTIIYKPLDLSLERKLDQWLDYCISSHPCIKNFMAILPFMSRKS